MTKVEFDFTEEQVKKIKKLEENGIDLGEAVDLLFEIKDIANDQMDKVDENINLVTQITQARTDEKKIEILEKSYSDSKKKLQIWKFKKLNTELNGEEISLNFNFEFNHSLFYYYKIKKLLLISLKKRKK